MRRAILPIILIALSPAANAQVSQNVPSGCFLAGAVTDAITGQPVRAAEVSVANLRRDGGGELRSVHADVNGRFSIADLATGRYLVQASRDGYLSPDHLTGHGLAIVALAPGRHLEDIALSLVPGGTISGRIVDGDAAPIPGASVRAMKYSFHEGNRELEEMASASANARGEYRLAGLIPGQYLLRVTDPRLAQGPRQEAHGGQSLAHVPLYYPSVPDSSRATPLAVSAGQELSGIDVSLAQVPAFHITGKVIDLRTFSPIKAEITLLSDRGSTYFSPAQLTTDAQGGFDLADVPQGSYVLVAQTAAERETTLWGHRELEVSDANVENVKVLIGLGVDVSGRLRVQGAADLSLGTLEAELKAREGATLGSLTPAVERVSVHPDGAFVFHHVPEGTYDISFSPLPGAFFIEGDGAELSEEGIRVGPTDAPQQLHPVLIAATAQIEGTVSGDSPVAGASVVLVPQRSQPRNYRTSVTNQLGKFTFGGVAPGDYMIFAWDEIRPDAVLDPDFLRIYEGRGRLVHLEESTHANMQLQIISSGTAR